MNAPYTGGFSPGANLFAVDGDFSFAEPIGVPTLANPMHGDSILGSRDIVLLSGANVYVRVPFGEGYNFQPFSANQSAIVFDQDFVVAREWFVPLPLNTPYYVPWSIGWQNTYVDLASCFLVEEGPLEDIRNGLVRFRRRYANLPSTRNSVESFTYAFPALQYTGDDGIRFPKIKTVNSRIQYDYYVWDDVGLLSGIGLFPAGHRLDSSTGLNPTGLILPEMRYFKPVTGAVNRNNQLDQGNPLVDGPPATVPSYSEYAGFAGFDGSSPAEIVAEASCLNQWLGNIYERKTRFVVAE